MVETAVQVKASLVLSFLIHGTRSQKVPQTAEIRLSQVVCRVQSIDWYCDAGTSATCNKSHAPSITATPFIIVIDTIVTGSARFFSP